MTPEEPSYWDGEFFPFQDGQPVLISQQDFEDCCCDGCLSCGEGHTQPSVVITTTAGSGDCAVDGTIPFEEFTDLAPEAICRWDWETDIGIQTFSLFYCRTTKTYCAIINPPDASYGGDADTCDCVASMTDVTEYVSCVNGVLTGTFELVGDAEFDCEEYTATVTLGGP